MSSRSVKRDIVYVSAQEARRLADAVMRIRLATYEYKDPAMAGRRRLGFIIEDNPGIPAADAEHGVVDLYAYASMLAATTQVQAAEIRALKRQVAALERSSRRR